MHFAHYYITGKQNVQNKKQKILMKTPYKIWSKSITYLGKRPFLKKMKRYHQQNVL